MITEEMKKRAAAINAFKTLPRTHWKQSYTGKAKTCCCGCAGNYSENPRAVSAKISRIIGLIESGMAESLIIGYPFEKRGLPIEQQVVTEIGWISVESNGRMHTVYSTTA